METEKTKASASHTGGYDTFGILDRWGDITPYGEAVQGIYHKGTRYISESEFNINDVRPLLLSSSVVCAHPSPGHTHNTVASNHILFMSITLVLVGRINVGTTPRLSDGRGHIPATALP